MIDQLPLITLNVNPCHIMGLYFSGEQNTITTHHGMHVRPVRDMTKLYWHNNCSRHYIIGEFMAFQTLIAPLFCVDVIIEQCIKRMDTVVNNVCIDRFKYGNCEMVTTTRK